MDFLNLEPTEENIKQKYFEDYIGRNSELHRFIEFLDAVGGGRSIAIDSNWGEGKTFYVKQAKLILDSLRENTADAEKVKKIFHKNQPKLELGVMTAMYYNAWKHDNEEQPLISLVYEIMKEKNISGKISNQRDRLKILEEIVKIIKPISKTLQYISDVSISDTLKEIKGKNIFEKLNEEKTVEKSIEHFFESLKLEPKSRLIIFVDELDRCQPTYAVKLLEQVKHYFMYEKVTFVFSVNLTELQHTIKQYYGESFNANRYLERFFDIRMGLPPANMNGYYDDLKLSAFKHCNIVVREIIKQMNMSMRDILKFLKEVRCATHKYKGEIEYYNGIDSRYKYFRIGMEVIVPIAFGLKYCDLNARNKFINGKDATWLINILCSERCKNCNYLSKEKDAKQKKDEIQEIYNVIFTETDFEAERGEILKAMNLVSSYSDYE